MIYLRNPLMGRGCSRFRAEGSRQTYFLTDRPVGYVSAEGLRIHSRAAVGERRERVLWSITGKGKGL